MKTREVVRISASQLSYEKGQEDIDYQLDRAPFTRYRWNGGFLPEAVWSNTAGTALVRPDGTPYYLDEAFTENFMARYINAHNLTLAEPLQQLSLSNAFTTAAYGSSNKEHAYGTPIFIDGGFRGYRYWMVGAPYPTQRKFTFTIDISTPSAATVTATAHGLAVGVRVALTTTGALPTDATSAGTPNLATNAYYVSATGYTANTFGLSRDPGGASIATSGSQSGVHTCAVSAPSFENPTIYVSNDGENFIEPPGIVSNPIAKFVGGLSVGNDGNSYYADPCIAFGPDKKLYVLWCWFNRAGSVKSSIMLSDSSDGLTWSTPVEILQVSTTAYLINSPSLFWDGSGWKLMAIDTAGTPVKIMVSRTASATPYTGWAAPSTVYNGVFSASVAVHPLSRSWWHGMFVPTGDGGVVGLCADNGSGGGAAYSLQSVDGGLTFSVQPFSYANPGVAGGTWYRPGLCVCADGVASRMLLYCSRIAPWQSGSTGGFYMQKAALADTFTQDTSMRQLLRDAVHRNLVAPVALVSRGLLVWDSFNRADGNVGTAESGQTYTTSSGSAFTISTNRLTHPAAGNNQMTFTVGSQAFDFEIQILTTSTNGMWFMWDWLDTSNFKRFGNFGTMQYNSIVGGGIVTADTATFNITPTAGDIFRLSKRGPRVTVYWNDRPVDSFYSTTNATSSVIGIQGNGGTPCYFDNLLVTQQ